jgi:hypothetical protein
VFFNSDKKAFSMAYKYEADGTTIYNRMDNSNQNAEGGMVKIAYVDSYRNVTFFEENLPKSVEISVQNVKLSNERTDKEKQAAKTHTPDTDRRTAAPDNKSEPESSAKPMPDISIGISEMNAFGYGYDGMLPLRNDRAAELFGKDYPIYLLRSDGTEAMAFNSSEITAHADNGGIFGIEREDWQKSQEYREFGSSASQEAAVESAFLDAKEDSFAIYQIMDGAENARDYRFEGLDYLKNRGLEVSRANYVLVHTDTLSQGQGSLTDIFEKYNVNTPAGFSGRSLSVSDVVALNEGGNVTSHYVDSSGFTRLPSFLGVEKQPGQIADKTEVGGSGAEEAKPQEQPSQQPPATTVNQDAQPQETQPGTDTSISNDSVHQAETQTPEVPFHEVAVYENTAKQAAEYGHDGTYSLNRYINIECAGAIDRAISDNKTGAHEYDLKTAARSVIATFGKERVIWVLSSIIQHDAKENAGTAGGNTFSDANREWGGKAATPRESPAFGCMTHKAVLNVFIKRFQEVAKEKPPMKDRLEVAKVKSGQRKNGQGQNHSPPEKS